MKASSGSGLWPTVMSRLVMKAYPEVWGRLLKEPTTTGGDNRAQRNAARTSGLRSTINDQMPMPSPMPQQPTQETQGTMARTETNTASPYDFSDIMRIAPNIVSNERIKPR